MRVLRMPMADPLVRRATGDGMTIAAWGKWFAVRESA